MGVWNMLNEQDIVWDEKPQQAINTQDIEWDTEPQISEAHPTRTGIMGNIVRPVAGGIGLIGGGIIGAGAGGIGAPIGAGLGYAAGEQAVDLFEEMMGWRKTKPVGEELLQAGRDILTGGVMEATGQVAGKIIGKGVKLVKKPFQWAGEKLDIPTTKTGQALKAGTILRETVAGKELTQEQITQNMMAAKELEKRIPGLKFSMGQLTNEADVIMLERSMARKGGGDLSQQQRAFADKTLRDYYDQKAVGFGKPEEFTAHIQKTKEMLESGSKEAEQAVNSEVMRLGRHMDEQSMGLNIWDKLSAGKSEMRGQATKLYNKIPNDPVNSNILNKTVDDLLSDFNLNVENASTFPMKIVQGIKRQINPSGKAIKNMNFQDLRRLRTTVMSEARMASKQGNDRLAQRLNQLRGGIENTINTLESDKTQAGELYREASSFYKEYVGKYKQGTVADVLTKGKRGEDSRVALANIAKEFYTLDGIDDFTRAVGNDVVARNAMKDYVSYDLLNSAKDPTTGKLVTNKAMQWMSRNSGKLKKLGLYDEFSNVVKMQRNADLVSKNLDIFNKSIAGRILEADTDDVIRNAFRGSKNYGATAQQLIAMVKGDKAAVAGLKKAFTENLIKESETTGLEFFQAAGAETPAEMEFSKSIAKFTKQVQKYAPAIRVMFRDEPEKIKAINDVWHAYQILGRTTKSPLGGGSDTAENFLSTVINVTAGATAPGKWYAFKSIRNAIGSFSQKQVDEYLKRALFDPEYATNLMSLTKEITPEKTQRLTNLMRQISYHGWNRWNEIQRLQGESTLK